VIEDILPRLEKVKKTGRGNWLACCPSHDDKSPSMTLHEAPDGRVLVRCWAGCSFEEIVGAVGLGWEPWFPPKLEQDHVPAVRRPYPAGDVLEALAFEATVVAVTAGDLARDGTLTDEARQRMWIAFDRICEGRRMALGER
jgi:hypothetical protein